MEAMISIAILSLVGTGLLISTNQARTRAASQAVAEQMAEVFRQARETAVASSKPVAVFLPVSAQSPLCDGYAIADGAFKAMVNRSHEFSSEYPDCYLFVGHWALRSGHNSEPSPLNNINLNSIKLEDWAAADQAVYAYTPTGTLLSNQVEFDGAYHIVACQSASWTSGQVGSVSSARLSAVNQPVTVRLFKAGQIEVVPSLAGQSLSGDAPPITASVRKPLTPSTRNNSTPVLDSYEISPKPEPDTQPDANTVTVALDGYITVRLEMSDADGDPLKVDWKVEKVKPPEATPAGTFSSPIETHSEIVDGHQISTWEWRPPPGAKPKEQFKLTGTISDGYGGITNCDLSAKMKKIEILAPGTILFIDSQRHGNREIYQMNNDGTRKIRLTYTAADEAWPQLSPDRTRILYIRNGELWSMDLNGHHPKAILRPGQLPTHQGKPMESIIFGCWSPDATRCAVVARYDGPTGGLDVYICDTDGNNLVKANYELGLSVTDAVQAAWCFTGAYSPTNLSNQYLLFTSPYDSDYFSFPLASLGNDQKHSSPSRKIKDLAASLDGKVAWVEDDKLWVGNYTPLPGPGLQGSPIASGPGITAPSWSPYCDMLVFSRGNKVYRVAASGGSAQLLTGSTNALEPSWGP